jgi:CheY-like chemotaxis protein
MTPTNRSTPVLVVVDADAEARTAIEAALVRRFGPDYDVVTADSAISGLEQLERLAAQGEDVALIAADRQLPGMDGVSFLERAHEFHRDASRVLLLAMDRYHTRIPLTELATLRRATALGRIDFWIVKGWVTPEEWLYPQVQEALSAWTIAHRPHHVVYRIIGEQWTPRSHDLRDLLSRNGVPFAFYPVDSPQGQQLLRPGGLRRRRGKLSRSGGAPPGEVRSAGYAAGPGLPPALVPGDHSGAAIPRSTWNAPRIPLPFETSRPGVFAAGDVRYGSVKRVAGAVGEGSVTVGSVHRYLSDASASS